MTANRMRARPANRYHRLLIPRLGAGDYLRLVEEEELAGGGRAKEKKEPLPLRYSRFVRAIELHGMARDDMGNQSLITHLVISQYRLSSRSPSRLCVSSFFSFSLSIVSFLVSSWSSCYCVSFSLIVVPIRAVIVFIVYHPLLLIYPLISPLSLPFLIAPYSPIAALRSPPLRLYLYRHCPHPDERKSS